MKANQNDICISVIVPIYNAENYLGRCLESIVEQTYRNLEIILVDDGSTDGSLGICEAFGKRDDRIHILHKENGGQHSARTAGVEAAAGDYIAFVDADDYIEADTYEILMKKLHSPDVDMLLYGLWEDYEDHSVLKQNHYQNKVYERAEMERELFPSMLSYGSFFDFGILPNLVCKLIKRSLWIESNIVVDDGVFVGEDADAVYQLLVNAQKVQTVEDAPYHYCKRFDSMMWKEAQRESFVKLEMDLQKAFQKAGVEQILQSQLKEYIAFVTLLKCPKEILGPMHIFENGKTALYGAGGFGQAVYESYKNEIALWVDKDSRKYAKMGYPVQSVESLPEVQEEYEQVFVAILNTQICKEIKDRLTAMGITKPIVYYDIQ